MMPIVTVLAILLAISSWRTMRSRGSGRGAHRACQVLMTLIGVSTTVCATAREFSLTFDEPTPCWQAKYDRSQIRVLKHFRSSMAAKAGDAGEQFQISVGANLAIMGMECEVPPTRWLDETSISLWLKGDLPGLAIEARVVFPETLDETTGKPVHVWLRGEEYESVGRWQQLVCQTSAESLRNRIQLYRAHTKSNIEQRGAYIDRVKLQGGLSKGNWKFSIDELLVRPFVAFEVNDSELASSGSTRSANVELRLDRLIVDGRPFLMRMGLHQGEDPALLKRIGLNTAWIRDPSDQTLLAQLQKEGIWSTATPPQPQGGPGNTLASHQAGISSFGPETEPILFWMLGSRLGVSKQEEIRDWAVQINDADHVRSRPLAGDVASQERFYSRHLFMLGLSRHIAHTGVSLREYQRWLKARRSVARPGTYCWTWIQTEMSPELQVLLPSDARTRFIEPELIRLQAYAAIAAGYRGIGFWNSIPFSNNTPAGRERAAVMELLNLELSLIEPWISGGAMVDQEAVRIETYPGQESAGRANANTSLVSLSRSNKQEGQPVVLPESNPRYDGLATVFRQSFGSLLVLSWLQDGAQYVPGPLTADEVTVVIPGVEQTASAWQISPTRIQSIPSVRKNGGVHVTLKKFDQVAFVLLTSDLAASQHFVSRVAELEEPAARAIAELASLKYERVKATQESLKAVDVLAPGTVPSLENGRRALGRAEKLLVGNDFHGAYLAAADSMQSLRRVQWNQWQQSVRKWAHATVSPYTLCYETLPQHALFASRFQKRNQQGANNLWPSGDFEDKQALLDAGWDQQQVSVKDVVAEANLVSNGRKGKGLRLAAGPATGTEVPYWLGETPVKLVSPVVKVTPGQIVQVTGWVKIPQPLQASSDGLLIYEPTLGKLVSRRLTGATSDWQPFELLRDIRKEEDFQVTFALTGIGEVWLDDVQLRVLGETLPIPEAKAEPGKPKPQGIDFRSRLPAIPSWSRPRPNSGTTEGTSANSR